MTLYLRAIDRIELLNLPNFLHLVLAGLAEWWARQGRIEDAARIVGYPAPARPGWQRGGGRPAGERHRDRRRPSRCRSVAGRGCGDVTSRARGVRQGGIGRRRLTPPDWATELIQCVLADASLAARWPWSPASPYVHLCSAVSGRTTRRRHAIHNHFFLSLHVVFTIEHLYSVYMNKELVEVLGVAEQCARDTLDTTVDHSSLLPVLTAHKNVIASLEARCASAVAKGNSWRNRGHRKPEDFVADTTGTSRSQAKKALDTANRLRDLPVVDDAVSKGKLSPQQVEQVAKAAAVDPSRQSELVETAERETLAGLKKVCQRVLRENDPDPEKTRERAHENRSCSVGSNDDGSAYVHWNGTTDAMAAMKAHLEAECARIFEKNRRNGVLDPFPARMADALTNLVTGNPTPDPAVPDADDPTCEPSAGTAPDSGAPTGAPAATTAMATTTSRDRSDGARDVPTDTSVEVTNPVVNSSEVDPASLFAPPPTPKPVVEKGHRAGALCRCGGRRPVDLTVLVDLKALRRGRADPGETCEILGVGQVPVSVARELLDDAFVRAVISNGVDIMTVAHFGRHCPEHLKTALLVRTRGVCEVPGCPREGRLEIDHNDVPYADGGPHSILNDALLCKPHHLDKTHGGHQLDGSPGQRIWRGPNGEILARDPLSDARQATEGPGAGLWDERRCSALSRRGGCPSNGSPFGSMQVRLHGVAERARSVAGEPCNHPASNSTAERLLFDAERLWHRAGPVETGCGAGGGSAVGDHDRRIVVSNGGPGSGGWPSVHSAPARPAGDRSDAERFPTTAAVGGSPRLSVVHRQWRPRRLSVVHRRWSSRLHCRS